MERKKEDLFLQKQLKYYLNKFNMKYFFLLVILCIVSCYGQKSNMIEYNIKGKWVSIQDDNYKIEIDDLHIVEFYGDFNNSVENERFDYKISHLNCGFEFKIIEKDSYFLKKTGDDDETYCYLISKCNDRTLTLVYQGGNILDFIRYKE